MGVPNTTTFTLQNVVTEVNPTTDDLVDCFADAVASKFDSAYEGSKNQLLNFRNYGAVTAFTTTLNPASNAKGGCAAIGNTTRYHDGSGTYPVVGDHVSNTSAGTGIPSNGYYNYTSTGVITYVLTTGVVTALTACP